MSLIQVSIAYDSIHVSGMIHCTGGGQSNVFHFVDQLRIIKDNLLPTPPLFRMIEEEAGLPRKEMYPVFNMGHRLEIYTAAESATRMTEISESSHIDAQSRGQDASTHGRSEGTGEDRGDY